MRFMVSTIGTSILTNLIRPDEHKWRGLLRDAANSQESELTAEVQSILDLLTTRAIDSLSQDDSALHRRISADLNGIYAVYHNQLPRHSLDIHYLICTDTAQGHRTGEILEDFLHRHGFRAQVFIPDKLSTQDTQSYSTGIKALINWCEETLPGYAQNGYEITFNLVGGFKSLQGYMNTIGMFYNAEIVYIFEADSADLITIPPFPIQLDFSRFEPHAARLAMMEKGQIYQPEAVQGIPDTLLEGVKSDDQVWMALSAWGLLMWKKMKTDIFSRDLPLAFPWLTYSNRFKDDVKNQRNHADRLRLIETLAKVAHLLEEEQGNTIKLRQDHALRYESFRSSPGTYKFRVDQGRRVRCTESPEGLTLERYGTEDLLY
ncbi:hypothetical protein NKDENANG_00759 [Candidatus Entotheonellaceae bacterium PAL068K]